MLGQVKVAEKSNEIVAIPALLDMLAIEGWSNESHAALSHVLATPSDLLALSLTSPEYLVN